MHAMQWVHSPSQTGLPSLIVMLLVGHSRAHSPQPVQPLPAANAFAFTKQP